MKKVTPFVFEFFKGSIQTLVLLFFIFVGTAKGQDATLSFQGFVFDTHDKPIVGADVQLKGTNKSTLTDANGEFFFKGLKRKAIKIEVSYLGYLPLVKELNLDTVKNKSIFFLQPALKKIKEVKVKSNRKLYLQRNNSISMELIEEEYFKENRTGSLMQTLSKVPGISSMDIGSGFSKPVIRGMGYYRVIVAQNGIRQEGQQWSNHHGLSIEQNNVNHVELIKGPASLQYGSGAIGGVVNILPIHLPLSQGIEGELSFTAKTNNDFLGGSGNITSRIGDIYTDLSLSYSYFGDFKVPLADSFLFPAPVNIPEASHLVPLGKTISNTAGREGAATFTIGIVKPWGTSSFVISYYENKNGFFDWQQLKNDSVRKVHEEKTHDILMPYQSVSHISFRHFTKAFFNNNKLEFALGFQKNISNEYSILFDRTGNRQEDLNRFNQEGGLDLSLLLSSWNLKISYTLNNLGKQQLVFGLNTNYQSHNIDGFGHILPKYNSASTGGFIIHKYPLSDKWILNSGVRFDWNSFTMEESLNPDPEYGNSVFNPEFAKVFPGLSLMLGLNYLPNAKTIFKFNLGKSYRIPSAYELGAYGMHRHEGRFEMGDTALNPEIAWQFDLGYQKEWNNFSLGLSPFLNYFTNYLYLNPTASLRSEGQVYEYVQSAALLTGGELNATWQVRSKISFNVGAEYVYAVNLDLMSAVPFTPPPSVISGVHYILPDKGVFKKNILKIEVVKAFAQNYTVPNELDTPGYLTVNFTESTKLDLGKGKLELVLRIQNILNTRYYNHMSFYRRLRIPEPGRNFQLGVTLPF